MMDSSRISFFQLLGQTFSFVFSDGKRFRRLTMWPAALLILGAVMALIEPYTLTEEARPGIDVNYPYAVTMFLFLLIIFTLEMVKVHRVVFYGDDGKYFITRFDRTELRYLLRFAEIMMCGFVLSEVTLFALYALVQIFMPTPTLTSAHAFLLAVFCMPYFVIRLFPVLPATVARDRVGLSQAWRMTSGIGLSLCVYYVLVLMAPLAISVLTGYFLRKLLPFGAFSDFVLMYVSILGLFGSCFFQAAFMSYAYSLLRRNEVLGADKKESI
jgi:hypothetical protein